MDTVPLLIPIHVVNEDGSLSTKTERHFAHELFEFIEVQDIHPGNITIQDAVSALCLRLNQQDWTPREGRLLLILFEAHLYADPSDAMPLPHPFPIGVSARKAVFIKHAESLANETIVLFSGYRAGQWLSARISEPGAHGSAFCRVKLFATIVDHVTLKKDA
jgi:hypothetical protein